MHKWIDQGPGGAKGPSIHQRHGIPSAQPARGAASDYRPGVGKSFAYQRSPWRSRAGPRARRSRRSGDPRMVEFGGGRSVRPADPDSSCGAGLCARQPSIEALTLPYNPQRPSSRALTLRLLQERKTEGFAPPNRQRMTRTLETARRSNSEEEAETGDDETEDSSGEDGTGPRKFYVDGGAGEIATELEYEQ